MAKCKWRKLSRFNSFILCLCLEEILKVAEAKRINRTVIIIHTNMHMRNNNAHTQSTMDT